MSLGYKKPDYQGFDEKNPEKRKRGVRSGRVSPVKSSSALPLGLQSVFSDPGGIFTARRRKLTEISRHCLIVLDTNILFQPFGLEDTCFSEMLQVYARLAGQGRLRIPAQVAREFAKNRSTVIARTVRQLCEQARELESCLPGTLAEAPFASLPKALIGENAVGHQAYDTARKQFEEARENLISAGHSLRDVLGDIATEIATTEIGDDPVSQHYKQIFTRETVLPDPECCDNQAKFQEMLKARFTGKRPPGYQDAAKPDGGAGDVIIWFSILEAGLREGQDCIFVTADQKQDWYAQTESRIEGKIIKQPFQPRLELLEEYRLTTGKTLHIIPPSKFLALFNMPEVEDSCEVQSLKYEAELPEEDYVELEPDITGTPAGLSRMASVLPSLIRAVQSSNGAFG